MDLAHKIAILTQLAVDDLDEDLKRSALRPINIRRLRPLPGRTTRLFRILLTSACAFNCHYCPMRRDRDLPRVSVAPERLARAFMYAYRRRWVDGLFVTTGIPNGPVRTMDRLIELLEILRHREHFRGYIHAKLVAGAEPAQVERIVALADRVSLNLEAACGAVLQHIAPQKYLDRSLHTLYTAARMARVLRDTSPPETPVLRSGITTQFVVGAGDDDDLQILRQVNRLYRDNVLHHAHFAAFRPIRNTPLENRPETPPVRERRLYQADYLMRQYGFELDEIVFTRDRRLPLHIDPKEAWARKNPDFFPVEVTTAEKWQLLRVPGLGPTTAAKLIRARRDAVLRDARDLVRLGVRLDKAAGYLTLNGRPVGDTRRFVMQPLCSVDRSQPHRVYEFSPGTFR